MRRLTVTLFLFALLCCLSNKAQKITIYNDEDFDFYTAIYYVEKTRIERATDPVLIASGKDSTFERPARKRSKKIVTFIDRNMVIAKSKNTLKPKLSAQEYSKLVSKNIGTLKGNSFFIATKEGKTNIFTYPEYKIINPFLAVMKTSKDIAKKIITRDLPQIRDNPYKTTVASVRQGKELNNSEKTYLTARLPRVKSALEKMLGDTIKTAPRIALVSSGGGYRAMVATLGSLAGAEQIGLLDATTWAVGLSGSTWAIGTWIQGGKSAQQHRYAAINAMSSPVGGIAKGLSATSTQEADLIAQALATKWIYNQPITAVDIYGSLLANRLFKNTGDKRQMQYLSQQVNTIKDGNTPMPIYTAVQLDKKKNRWHWYEFTPYEVGSLDLQMYIPSWAYGKNFNHGKSHSSAPQQSLSTLFGTFGSAFAVTAQKIFEGIASKFTGKYKALVPIFEILLKTSFVEKKYKQYATFQLPLSYAKVRNPFENVGSQENNSFIGNEFIELVDAGLAFNLPYPPISGQNARQSDILIFLDASQSFVGAPDLKKSEAYARSHNLKFPPINYTNIEKKIINVFKNESDPTVPVVIYMPLVQDKKFIKNNIDNPEFDSLWKKADGSLDQNIKNKFKKFDLAQCLSAICKTVNFTYPEQEALMLSTLTIFNMIASKEQIIEAIRWKLAQ